jgi:hypothetical protein
MGDAKAFVREAVGIAANREHRATMGQAAREAALRLGWDGVIARFETVLLHAIQSEDESGELLHTSAARPLAS